MIKKIPETIEELEKIAKPKVKGSIMCRGKVRKLTEKDFKIMKISGED